MKLFSARSVIVRPAGQGGSVVTLKLCIRKFVSKLSRNLSSIRRHNLRSPPNIGALREKLTDRRLGLGLAGFCEIMKYTFRDSSAGERGRARGPPQAIAAAVSSAARLAVLSPDLAKLANFGPPPASCDSDIIVSGYF